MKHIAFSCDDGYARHVGVVIRSILAHAAPPTAFEFHILSMDLQPESQRRLQACAEGQRVNFLNVDFQEFVAFPISRHTVNAYSRLLLADLLPVVSRVLYLDADLLVFDDISTVFDINVSDSPGAAADDASCLFGGNAIEHYKEIGFPLADCYMNSGVLLMNLDYWRANRVGAGICAWIRENSTRVVHADQDAINVVLAGKFARLPLRWNVQVPLIEPVRFGWGCTREMAAAVASPGIVHYTGSGKPWKREFPLPYQSEYFRHLAETPWGKEPLPVLTFRQKCERVQRLAVEALHRARTAIRRALGRVPLPT